MTAMLTDNLPLIAAAPGGIKKLRELILELAVRGALVPQDANDEPAIKLLGRIRLERERLIREGVIRPRSARDVSSDVHAVVLPTTWVWTTLADVALVNPRNSASDDSEASFVPMTYIGTRFEGTHQQDVRVWKEIKQGFTHFAEGDIAVAKITPCFENSKACVFSSLKNGIGAGTTELHVVRPISGLLAPRYVLAYLKSPRFLAIGESGMSGTAGQKRLPKEFVESNPFPLPPLAEQHRIVTKVDELMALCDRLESGQTDSERAHQQLVTELLATLVQSATPEDFAANWQRLSQHFDTLFTTEASIDALKQTILQLAVMGKLVPQDPRDEPASALMNRIDIEKSELASEGKIKKQKLWPEVSDDEKIFEPPSGWKWVRLGELAEANTGHAFKSSEYKEHGTFVLRVTNIRTDGSMDPSDAKYIDPVEASTTYESVQLNEDDILLVMVGGSLGKIGIVDRSVLPAVLNQNMWKIGRFGGVPRDYLIYGLRFINSTQIKITNSTHGHLAQGEYLSKLFPLPPLAEQHRIVTKVDELMSLCNTLKSRLTESRAAQEKLAAVFIEQSLVNASPSPQAELVP